MNIARVFHTSNKLQNGIGNHVGQYMNLAPSPCWRYRSCCRPTESGRPRPVEWQVGGTAKGPGYGKRMCSGKHGTVSILVLIIISIVAISRPTFVSIRSSTKETYGADVGSALDALTTFEEPVYSSYRGAAPLRPSALKSP